MQSSQDQEVSQKEAEEEVTTKPLPRQRESPQLVRVTLLVLLYIRGILLQHPCFLLYIRGISTIVVETLHAGIVTTHSQAVVQAPRSFGRVHSTESGTPRSARSGSLAQSAPPVESRPAQAAAADPALAPPPLDAAQLFQAAPNGAQPGPMVGFGQPPPRGLQFPHQFGAGLLQGINPAHLPFSSFSPLGGAPPLLDQGLPMFGGMGGRVPHLAVETAASSAASVGNAARTAATASGGSPTAGRRDDARAQQGAAQGRKREGDREEGGRGKRGRQGAREEPRGRGRGRVRGKPPRHRPSPVCFEVLTYINITDAACVVACMRVVAMGVALCINHGVFMHRAQQRCRAMQRTMAAIRMVCRQ